MLQRAVSLCSSAMCCSSFFFFYSRLQTGSIFYLFLPFISSIDDIRSAHMMMSRASRICRWSLLYENAKVTGNHSHVCAAVPPSIVYPFVIMGGIATPFLLLFVSTRPHHMTPPAKTTLLNLLLIRYSPTLVFADDIPWHTVIYMPLYYPTHLTPILFWTTAQHICCCDGYHSNTAVPGMPSRTLVGRMHGAHCHRLWFAAISTLCTSLPSLLLAPLTSYPSPDSSDPFSKWNGMSYGHSCNWRLSFIQLDDTEVTDLTITRAGDEDYEIDGILYSPFSILVRIFISSLWKRKDIAWLYLTLVPTAKYRIIGRATSAINSWVADQSSDLCWRVRLIPHDVMRWTFKGIPIPDDITNGVAGVIQYLQNPRPNIEWYTKPFVYPIYCHACTLPAIPRCKEPVQHILSARF